MSLYIFIERPLVELLTRVLSASRHLRIWSRFLSKGGHHVKSKFIELRELVGRYNGELNPLILKV